jgi:hypothetical protein
MKRLVIILLFGLFFFGSKSRAQDIYLNCKWEQGRYVQGGLETVRKKGDYNTADIMITIDFNKKKIISSPAASFNRGEENKVFVWDEKHIEWNVEKKQYKIIISVKLKFLLLQQQQLLQLIKHKKNLTKLINEYFYLYLFHNGRSNTRPLWWSHLHFTIFGKKL